MANKLSLAKYSGGDLYIEPVVQDTGDECVTIFINGIKYTYIGVFSSTADLLNIMFLSHYKNEGGMRL